MADSWRVKLLGGLSASRGQHTVSRFPTQKVAGLLAYLTLYPDRNHPREELAELFWPQVDSEQGRVSLRTALVALRKVIEPSDSPAGSILHADRLTVRLIPGTVETDLAEFERAVHQARATLDISQRAVLFQTALQFYAGDLLPGFYEDWVLVERTRLAQLRLDVLQSLINIEEERSNFARASDYARQVVQGNPLDEEAHQRLIEYLLASGQTTAAQRQYEEMERILHAELNTRPAHSFQALVERGGKHHLSSTSSGRPTEKVAVSEPSDPLRSLPRLPLPLTPFFGRQEEIARLLLILDDPERRLVTLTGLGGFGKTRLVLEVARHLREQNKPVCFVPLAGMTEPRLIGEAMCQSLGVPPVTGGDPLEHALRFMGGYEGRFYLVLDNLEQLVPDGLPQVERILNLAPSVTCLLTSRIPLALSYEWEYPVGTLPTPIGPTLSEQLLDFASVRLFTHRAQAVRPDFAVTESNAPAVARLSHALDGIPLAIELAAARASVLTPEQMVGYMTDRFQLLTGRSRDIAERQRTLRTVLDWSCQALPDEQRRLFARLSVFQGNWSLEAVQAVCEDPNALDNLTDLQRLSLVVVEEQNEEMRYRLLETVREYAGSLLPREEREILLTRHLAYYTQRAEEEEKRMRTPEQGRAVARLELDYENIRSALLRALEKDRQFSLRLARAPAWFWQCRGYLNDGLQLCKAVLRHPENQEPTPNRADVLNAVGALTYISGDPQAAEIPLHDALQLSRAIGHERGVSESLNLLGMVTFGAQDFERALPFLEEALALGPRSGGRWYMAPIYLWVIYYGRGDLAQAFAVVEGLRQDAIPANSQWMNMAAHLMLGILQSEEGHVAEAERLLCESLFHAADAGDRIGIAYVVRECAVTAGQKGEWETAALFWGSLDAMMERMGMRAMLPFRQPTYQRAEQEARTSLAAETFTRFWEEGRMLTWDEAISLMQEKMGR